MVARNINRVKNFLHRDIWKVKLETLPRGKAFFYRLIRVWIISISEFNKDKCSEKASALTYFSLLSIVPVVAMAFGIATIFGLEDYMKGEMATYFSGQQEVLDYTLQFANKMLATSSGGIISGISAAFLIYAVANLLNNIEVAFNDIWNTKSGRSIKRKLTDYMSVILLGPLILILSSSATVFITSSIDELTQSVAVLGFFRPIILFFIQLIPYTLIWFLLFLVYIVFPNTTVKLKSALIAGILAGTAYQITQFAWIEGQVFLSRYSVIYGSFAALPLFLIWLQLSWMILLFGAEFAFALQNVGAWSYDSEDLRMNQKYKRRMSLLIMRGIVKHFEREDAPISFELLCTELNIPRRFIREIVDDLERVGLVVKVASTGEEELYQPGLDMHKIDVYMVYDRLDGAGMESLPQAGENEGYAEIEAISEQVDEAIKSAKSNKKILDL